MIKCLAVDDEPLALSQLTRYIAQTPFLQLVAACQDAFEAMKVMSEETVELIFIDINMPDLSGLDFVRSLVEKPLVIFTTAYSEYAVEGFKLDAVDYLLKPFAFHDFLKAADKAHKHLIYMRVTADTMNAVKSADDFLFVETGDAVVRIVLSDVKFIEDAGNFLKFHTIDAAEPVIGFLSMKKIEERLSKDKFVRVHKSYIVNLNRITEISRLRIIFDKKTYIPVAEAYRENFQECIRRLSSL